MWSSSLRVALPQALVHIEPWLSRPYRLAQVLRQVARYVSIDIQFEGVGAVLLDECTPLGLTTNALVYVREVRLIADDVPVCAARIAMPMSTYTQYQSAFDTLGSGFLGDQLLYDDASVTRSGFEFAVLTEVSPFVMRFPGLSDTQLQFPARRSVFVKCAQYPLLVTECFLQTVPHYPGVTVS